MVQVGKYKIGFGALSTMVVFIVLSVCAVVAAFQQVRPEWPMPLSSAILVNLAMALLATLVYGVFVHFAIDIINRLRKK